MADTPDIDVHKLRLRIVADATAMQTQGGIADFGGGHSRDANVDSLPFDVLAVHGHAGGGAAKEFVAPRSAVAADDINLSAGTAEGRGKVVQQIEKPRVQLGYVTGSVVAQKMIQPVDRVREIGIAPLVHDVDALIGVQMEERQAPLLDGHAIGFGNPRWQKQNTANQQGKSDAMECRAAGEHPKMIAHQRRPQTTLTMEGDPHHIADRTRVLSRGRMEGLMKTLDVKTRIQLNNILYTTDFSTAAAAALPYAGQLAKTFGANLFALHVRAPVINPMTPPAGWPALEKAAAKEDRERGETLRNAFSGIEPTVLMEEGDLWTCLQAVIERRKIDLLVIGTHGRSGVDKFVLGSAAEEILRDVSCPVLTIGPHVPVQPLSKGEFTQILYATSFGAESAAVAAFAVSVAEEFQAKLTLLHVLEDAKAGDVMVPQDLVNSSKRRLADLVPPEAEVWCSADYCVERGKVADKILEVARGRKADLIVMGVHSPTGVPGAATHLGIATAHKVVSQAHCPVLTVRG